MTIVSKTIVNGVHLVEPLRALSVPPTSPIAVLNSGLIFTQHHNDVPGNCERPSWHGRAPPGFSPHSETSAPRADLRAAVAVWFTEAINNTVACFQNGRFVSPRTVRLEQVTHAAFACAPAVESLRLFYPQSRVQPAN